MCVVVWSVGIMDGAGLTGYCALLCSVTGESNPEFVATYGLADWA